MPFAPQAKDIEVSLSVFGGLVTDTPAASLPEGVSPDCANVVFVPGDVASRPALKKVFDPPFPAGGASNFVPTMVYGKTLILPTGAIQNLYLDSNGNLYFEDVSNNPGVYNLIGSFTPGSWAKSVTAFGREYIAISDTLHGADIPLQWDGTNLDRVTQDGPGAPPTVASVALPSVALAASGAGAVLNLTESDPAAPDGSGNFTQINTWTGDPVTGIVAGNRITIAGYGGASAAMNGTWSVVAVFTGGGGGYANLLQLAAYLPSTTINSVAAATGTVVGAKALVRAQNTVTATTVSAHQLQVGYQAQIAGVKAASIGGGVSSIKIANEDNPGIATVTMASAHGLIPGAFVSLTGVAAVAVGGVATSTYNGGVGTVTTTTAHGLAPGAVVTLTGPGLTVTVLTVASPTTFTFAYAVAAPVNAVTAVSLNWPIPDSPDPTFFEVLAAPTATTFQIAINYSDGTWTTGTVTYPWNGTFFVTAIPSATSFQYQQYGPDDTFNVSAGETATPYGQVAPGLHQCRVAFVTRNGAITRPSPPVQFVASGGQYLSISSLPIGPPNIVARILEFTGAGGAYFFYIPATPEENGQVVGTATQINDNTSTTAFLDFADATLFAATATSIPGNDLAAQIIIDGALGFGLYASRLVTWGQRNRIQNLLNLSFDGGQFYTGAGGTASNFPCGWTQGGAGAGGALAAGHWGLGWKASGAGSIFQGFFEDADGAPIATPNQPYTLRAWVQGAGASLTATISSAASGFTSSATVNGTTGGAFSEAAFSNPMPTPIPPDMVLTLTWTGTPLIDEISIIYAETPYTDTVMMMSYADNPEGLDGVTGKIGSTQDEHKIMGASEIRRTGYFLTQDPGGRLHQFSDNGVTEPSGWTVDEVAANCGLLSAFGVTTSQADDSTASGGEEWFAWASYTGARIFGGDQPWKISQEIDPTWNARMGSLPRGRLTTWALNDPVARILYFGLPGVTAPITVLTMSYRQLDSAFAIGNTGPIRIGFSGKLIATDHARKWAPWFMLINGAALMSQSFALQPVFFGGNGQLVGSAAGHGNVYTLDPFSLTDDDYGLIAPYWVTSFLPGHEREEAAQVSGFRKQAVYLAAFVFGTGNMKITPYVDTLQNAWPLTVTRPMSNQPTYDLECAAGAAQGNRIAFKFASIPDRSVNPDATNNGFSLQRLTIWLRKAQRLPIRGAA